MTVQQIKNLRELNRFLKTASIDMPMERINEVKTRAKKRKGSSFMVWVNAQGSVVDLSIDG
jgi:hypothetical protein